MPTTQVIEIEGGQAVRLPEEFRFSAAQVSIRKDGQAVVLEPLKAKSWPPNFFDEIYIEDAAFTRPPQGEMPPAPRFH